MTKPRNNRWARMWEDGRGGLHRKDGPAVEEDNGAKAWYWKGNLVYQEYWSSNYGMTIRNHGMKWSRSDILVLGSMWGRKWAEEFGWGDEFEHRHEFRY